MVISWKVASKNWFGRNSPYWVLKHFLICFLRRVNELSHQLVIWFCLSNKLYFWGPQDDPYKKQKKGQRKKNGPNTKISKKKQYIYKCNNVWLTLSLPEFTTLGDCPIINLRCCSLFRWQGLRGMSWWGSEGKGSLTGVYHWWELVQGFQLLSKLP